MTDVRSAIKCCVAVGESEGEKNVTLVRHLKRRGIDAQLVYGQGPDVVGDGFLIECKWDLLSKAVLDRLIGQLVGYMQRNHCRVFVVVYNDAKYPLLVELVDFCRRQSYAPGVEVIVLRDVIK